MVDSDDARAEPESRAAADERGAHDNEERKLQIMHADLPRGVAEGLELRDLLALQPDEPREHRAGHESGDAQEDRGKCHGDAVQHAQFVVQPRGGGMISPAVGHRARRRARECGRGRP